MTILGWNDLYYQLWTQAAQSRGTVTNISTPLSAGDAASATREWPRTNGADALAIAALVDPVLAAVALRPGGYGVTRLWQSAVIDLESVALFDPAAEYRFNPAFWAALLAVASYLDTLQAPMPDIDALETILDGLWAPAPYRNAGENIKTVTESTAEKMWATQRKELTTIRGSDVHEFPGAGSLQVPRSTNADVARLADYWAGQFSSALVRMIFNGSANTMGLEGQQKRWSDILSDVDKYARQGKPGDVYPKNNEFWHETNGLAVNLASWGEVPTRFELAADATAKAVVDLPGRLVDAAAAAAKAAGNAAKEIGAGFLSGFGKPLLIGGAAVVGLLVVLRLTRGKESAHGG